MRDPHKNTPASARRPSTFAIAVALGFVVAGWQPFASGAPSAAEQEYRQALELARTGRHDQALESLAGLVQRYPENRQYLYDYVAVLGWAERDRAALDAAAGLDLAQSPGYVLRSVGRSARNQREFPQAIDTYRMALEKDPKDDASRIGLALSLADHGDQAQAREILDTLAERRPQDMEVLAALAYVQQSQGQPFQALDTYDRMLRIDPDNTQARRGRILTTLRLGAPHLAADMADATPGLVTPAEHDAIEREKQAMSIRWSRLPATSQTVPERETYKAVLELRQEMESLEDSGQGDTPHARTVRYDLLVSLHDLGRHQEVIDLYETRIAGEQDIPSYVLSTAGQSYLELRRPEEARDLFLRVLELEPKNFAARMSLFYAYVDSEDFDHALPLIDQIAAEEPVWLGTPPNHRPNSARLQADITAANARAFADDLAEAERRLSPLAEQAPRNAEIQTALATVYLWRDWPHRSLGTYEIALNGQPADMAYARAGRGQALMNLGDYPAAEAALRQLQETAPDSAATRALERDWELRNMRQLRMEAARTESSGVQEGSENLGFNGWLYGAPLRYHYRPFLHHHFEQAEFPEGNISYSRIGAGVEYQARELVLNAELDRDAGDTVNTGVAVNGRWSPSDHWSFTAAADSYSDDVPLRGRLNEDIDGWSVGLGADWRAHEGRSAAVGVQTMEFSDDNQRTSASARAAQRLMTRPHYRMEGLLGVYASRNTREGAPYFNPASDLSLDLTLNNEWLLYRRYEYSFRHRLALSAGNYHQEDFGSDGTWALQYEQRWSPHDQFDLGYGAVRARRVYDGVPEYQTTLYLNLNWLF